MWNTHDFVGGCDNFFISDNVWAKSLTCRSIDHRDVHEVYTMTPGYGTLER